MKIEVYDVKGTLNDTTYIAVVDGEEAHYTCTLLDELKDEIELTFGLEDIEMEIV